MDTPIEASPRRPHEALGSENPTVITFGETLVDAFHDREVLGGAPFNVTCHLGALGAHPILVTRAGNDLPGERLLRAMRERGLDVRGVQRDPARPTGRVTVSETPAGHTFDILPDRAYDHIQPLPARKLGCTLHPRMVYFGMLAQRGESRRALHALLGAVDARLFLDVNLRDPWVDTETLLWSLRQADVIKLNEDELMRIGDLLRLAGATPHARAAALITRFGLDCVVVTCGAAGAWALDGSGRVESVAGAPLPRTVDTVGAGDGFAAVFMLGMLRGWTVAEQLQRADAFGRALCGIRGAVPATSAFYESFIHDWKLETEVARA